MQLTSFSSGSLFPWLRRHYLLLRVAYFTDYSFSSCPLSLGFVPAEVASPASNIITTEQWLKQGGVRGIWRRVETGIVLLISDAMLDPEWAGFHPHAYHLILERRFMSSCPCLLSCFSRVWLFAALWTLACQAPLSMGFSRQKYWSGLPCLLLQGIFLTQGSNPHLLHLLHWQVGSLSVVCPGKSPCLHTSIQSREDGQVQKPACFLSF